MFAAETTPLPELARGEILVKVIFHTRSFHDQFYMKSLLKVRLASICMSDVHTVTGQRIEPTPR